MNEFYLSTMYYFNIMDEIGEVFYTNKKGIVIIN